MDVAVTGVHVDLAGKRIVSDASFDVQSHGFLGVIGPNGSGKSTLLRSIYRAFRPVGGSILVGGDDVWKLDARTAACRTAVVAQDSALDFDFTVEEIIELGRVPHHGLFSRSGRHDRDVVERAMELCDVACYAGRAYASLSGGERQRVALARALAQEPQLLVLDEPTNHLDVSSQFELLELARSLPVTVIAALHDLNLTAAFCDSVVVLRDGRVVAGGPTEETLDEALIRELYGVDVAVVTNPLTGRRMFALASLPDPSPA